MYSVMEIKKEEYNFYNVTFFLVVVVECKNKTLIPTLKSTLSKVCILPANNQENVAKARAEFEKIKMRK